MNQTHVLSHISQGRQMHNIMEVLYRFCVAFNYDIIIIIIIRI